MNALGLFVRATGRSWWQARHRDGRITSEWDTVVGLVRSMRPRDYAELGPRSRWEELGKRDLVGLRLLCPNGQAGDLRAPRDHAFFQLKVGTLIVGRIQSCEAQVVGVVDGPDTRCKCFAWEVRERRLVAFEDDVAFMRYRQVGPLGIENLELKV